nr:MAG TPA_asm: Cytosine specific methyltransferase [Caudoviricetes sp.]
MRHLGDITRIRGCAAPVVDVVIGGSPCQDLSIAGKRAGLAGERSGLYRARSGKPPIPPGTRHWATPLPSRPGNGY